MKYLYFLAASALLFTWTACGEGASADTTNTTQPSTEVIPEKSTVLPPANVTKGVDTTKPITTTTPAPTVTAGLNPAHGQPGHRCDIAVGAPLDSKAVQQTVVSPTLPVTTTTTTTTQSIAPTTVTTVAPGMNPAHGQPGHRCDIAVGAPLNSEPVQVKSQPVTTTTLPLTSPTITTTSPVATTKVAPGMNPAHGQPGHRCDIAVGAPLDSKPVTQAPVKTQTLPTVTPIIPVPETKKQQ